MGFLVGLLGGGGSQQSTNQAPAASGINIQTSCYGKPVPLVWGMNRAAANMIEYGNFQAISHTQPSNGGGGGKGGNPGGGGQTTYTYSVNIAFGLSEGPITGVGNIWVGASETTAAANGWTIYQGTYPQTAHWTEVYTGLAYSVQDSYGLGANTTLPNLNWEIISTFSGLTLGYVGGTTPADGYGQLIATIASQNVSVQDAITTLVTAGVLTRGTITQVPLPAAPAPQTVTDADPSLQILDFLTNPYYGVGFPASRLGGVALQNEHYIHIPTTPFQITVAKAASYGWNLNVADGSGNLFTCVTGTPTATQQYSYNATTGVYTFYSGDAGIAINIRYVSYTGFADFQAYCIASGLWISPVYDSQTAANSLLDDTLTACFSTVVWSSGVLNIVPYGTTTVSANNFTWHPPAYTLYNLNDDDFMDPNGPNASSNGGNSNTDPVLVTRERPADQLNTINVEFVDITNQYAPAIATIVDQAHIDTFGKRSAASMTMHQFTNVISANISAQLQLQKEQKRNKFSFTLDQRYCVLDPMDIVTVTDGAQDILQVGVRILEMTENDDGSIAIIAEEYPLGTGVAGLYTVQTGTGYLPDYNLPPGPVNPPEVFAAPPQIASNQALEMFVAISGSSSNWGGAAVYVSSDNNTYRYLGRNHGVARMGITTSDLPVGSDPDTSDSFSVNLSQSNGQLLAGTKHDADTGYTACLVRGNPDDGSGDEYITYQNAILNSPNNYTLGTYIRRGFYQTDIKDHSPNSAFIRIDDSLFAIPFQPSDIGTTLYLKLCSFNIFDGGQQDLSDAIAYPIVVPQPPRPPDVENFQVQQNGAAVAFKWDDIPYPLVALAGYFIGYAPVGTTDWSRFIMLTKAQGGNGTEMTNADVPPGTWTFGIRAANIANSPGSTNGLSPHITTQDLKVTNANTTIAAIDQAPAWPGQLLGFIEDFRGFIIPGGTNTAINYGTATHGSSSTVYYADPVFDSFVPEPMPLCRYIAPVVDAGFDEQLRISFTDKTGLGPLQGVNTDEPTFALDTWLTGFVDPNIFFNWIIGNIAVRYVRAMLVYLPTPGYVQYISDFTAAIDQVVSIVTSGSVVVAAGGTIVSFGRHFNVAPFVIPTAQAATPLYATAAAVGTDSFTAHVWNAAGTDVGGVISWQATGE